jgi:TolB-like protein
MRIDNFFAELKRRNVYKVAVAYAVVGWLLVQVATQVFPFFEIPNWAVRLIVLAIVIGFPIALVIAWAFEATPEGIKRTKVADALPSTPSHRKHAWIYVVGIGAAISVALFFFGRYTAGKKTSPKPNDISNKSIAVLPFENLSSDKENAYFAAGIQDEIITRLAKIGALKVISRTSTSHFASSPQNLPEIARQLGVANILEGSVQKAREAVHVNVQLIRTATDDHLWAESYDRKLDDIFGVEKEVAQSIASALNAKLTGAEEQALAQKPTANSSAYDAYLRGNTLFWESNEEALLQAVESYEQAVRLDPQFAIAWAALARAQSILYAVSNTTSARQSAAEQALAQAERLQPEAPETKIARAFFNDWVTREYEKVISAMEQAHRTWPGNVEVLQLLGWATADAGDWRRSSEFWDEALVLSPRDPMTRYWAAERPMALREFDKALRMLDEALGIFPDNSRLLTLKIETLQAIGRLDEAQQLVDKLHPALGDWPAVAGIVYQAKLRRDPAATMKTLLPLAQPTERGLTWLGNLVNYAQLQEVSGDKDGAHRSFTAVREKVDTLLQKEPRNINVLIWSAMAALGLEVRDAALRAIDRLDSIAAMTEPERNEFRARTLIRFGDKDRAIAILQSLLQRPCRGFYSNAPLTPSLLRLDPDFDPLRGDPRFQKLCEEKSK